MEFLQVKQNYKVLLKVQIETLRMYIERILPNRIISSIVLYLPIEIRSVPFATSLGHCMALST